MLVPMKGYRCVLACVAALAAVSLASGATYREHLEVLGLKPGASEKDIAQAYRRQALKWHPDKSSAPDARERFTRVAEAYEVGVDRVARIVCRAATSCWDRCRCSDRSGICTGLDSTCCIAVEYCAERPPTLSRIPAQRLAGAESVQRRRRFNRRCMRMHRSARSIVHLPRPGAGAHQLRDWPPVRIGDCSGTGPSPSHICAGTTWAYVTLRRTPGDVHATYADAFLRFFSAACVPPQAVGPRFDFRDAERMCAAASLDCARGVADGASCTNARHATACGARRAARHTKNVNTKRKQACRAGSARTLASASGAIGPLGRPSMYVGWHRATPPVTAVTTRHSPGPP